MRVATSGRAAWTLLMGLLGVGGLLALAACRREPSRNPPIEPVIVAEPVAHDSEDPAIWIHPTDRSQSLIVATDKHPTDGALVVYDLQGHMIRDRTVRGLRRPNNVDVEYGLELGGRRVDVAVTTERDANRLRVHRLPDMAEIDGGGIEVFEGEALRQPMGIALYRRPRDGAVFAVISRSKGPTTGGYLWQYRLEDDGRGRVKGTRVRQFGLWSGRKTAESVAVDDALGYVYYSDEQFGVRKYAADPDSPDAGRELALFATTGFAEDHEGISVYALTDGTGYILVSDQGASRVQIFPREGEPGRPHSHPCLKVVRLRATESDGSDATSASLGPLFPGGLFVAMSNDRRYHFYSWKDMAGTDLAVAPDGARAGLR